MHPNAQPLEEAQRQLSLLLQQQEELAPALYRDLALYLQVLREGLLPAVQQSCFHLATQVVPERYARLPQERRSQFQQRLSSLVQRCTALLTVEQVMGLASQQQQREHRRRRSQRQQMLQAVLEARDPGAEPSDGEGSGGSGPEADAAGASGIGGSSLRTLAATRGAATVHPASVSLGLDLPLSADLFDRGIPGLPPVSGPGPAGGRPGASASPAGDAATDRTLPPTSGAVPSDEPGPENPGGRAGSSATEPSEGIAGAGGADEGPGTAMPREGGSDGAPVDVGSGAPGFDLWRARVAEGPTPPLARRGEAGSHPDPDSAPEPDADGAAPCVADGVVPDGHPGVDKAEPSGNATPDDQADPPAQPAEPAVPAEPAQAPHPAQLSESQSSASSVQSRSSAEASGAESDLLLLQSLFQMVAEGLGQEMQRPLEGGGDGPASLRPAATDGAAGDDPADLSLKGPFDGVGSAQDSEDAGALGRLALSVAARIEPLPDPDPAITGSSLPRDPLRQLAWWRHFDRALSRRLRNLSHALNVEMMRLGLAQGLLPLNLLDAVLEGQVEALPAPANLLRLPLPLPPSDTTPTEVLALLLRPSDLEFGQPRLRTCRRRLEQRRRALRTMAKRYRIWQRRVTALEAEQQWFRDSAQPQSQPLEPS